MPSTEPSREEVEAFRARVRAWFDANATPRRGAKFTGEGADRERAAAWHRKLRAAGFVGLTWPHEHGGAGAPAWQERVLREVADSYEETAEDVFGVAVGLVGPALIAHGTPAQQARYLPAILAGDEVWCQLFSEPNAGSDLASLRTTARADGEEFVVDGQKVWSSGAHLSDFGLLLARTDPDQPGARGVSCFVLPMHLPGVEVRPLRQLTGDAHFCEVFLDGVRVGRDALVGPLHGGWAVTRTVLAQERALVGVGGGLSVPFAALATLARERAVDPVARDRIVQAYVRERVVDLLGRRIAAHGSAAEASLVKLAMAEHVERTVDLALAIVGAGAMCSDGALTDEAHSWQRAFLGQWLVRIGGGTAQIQRNIIGERVLGLPAEPRA